MKFSNAPWDSGVWAWTSGTVALLTIVFLTLGLSRMRSGWLWGSRALVLLALFGDLPFVPRSLRIDGTALESRMVAYTVRYDLTRATSAEGASDGEVFGPWTVRTFGVGGAFGYYGRFSNPKLGNFTAYVTNRHNLVVLRFPERAFVVSPEDRGKPG